MIIIIISPKKIIISQISKIEQQKIVAINPTQHLGIFLDILAKIFLCLQVLFISVKIKKAIMNFALVITAVQGKRYAFP